MKQASSFSEEKEEKRLLSIWVPALNGQKFFGSFFQKRTASFL
jgi:hypothetical protein